MGKKGSEKYYIIISLILGLMVLGLSLYFIFHEYFTSEDIDWEICRQSVIFRSGKLKNIWKWIQENAPFKCKTQVIEIDFKDKERVEKLIADTMASCWWAYGEGKTPLYGENPFRGQTMCFVCARIHFNENVKAYYAQNKPWLGGTVANYEFDGKQTIGEYVYKVDKGKIPAGFSQLRRQNLNLLNFIDPNKGDVFITFAYYIPSAAGEWVLGSLNLIDEVIEGRPGVSIVVSQPGVLESELDCDVYETIPA